MIITGLDLGSSNIKGVVVEKRKDGDLSVISTFRHPSLGFMKGVLVDSEEALKSFRSVVMDLESISKKATRNIFISINGKYIKPRPSQGIVAVSRADQEIQQDDVDRVDQASRAIKLSSNYTILHNITSEYFVDEVGEIKNPIGMTGGRLEVSTLIVQAFAPHIQLLANSLEKVGGMVSGVVFSPLAAAEAVLSKRQKDLGVLLIDMGFGTTSFVVYEEGRVAHTKSIPVGSGHVTNDIAIGLRTPIDVAEKLKSMYGYALSKDVGRGEKIDLSDLGDSGSDEVNKNKSRRLLAEIIEVRLEETLDLIHNELQSLGKQVQLPAGVVITGGGVKLAGVEDLAKQELKLATRIGYPDISDMDVSNPTHQELLEDPEFSAATGLVLWGNRELKGPTRDFGKMRRFFRNLMP